MLIAIAVAIVSGPVAGGVAKFLGFASGTLGNAVVGGAIAGAAGSVASQAVGVMTGIQDKFSWNAVALAAIGGGVGGGLKASGFGGGGVGGAVARGAVGSAITQGIGVATGLQDKFSWAGVAAAGVIGGVMRGLLDHFDIAPLQGEGASQSPANIAAHVAVGTASAIAGAATRSLIEGSDFGDNVLASLPDVIGTTIGEAVAGRIAGRAHTGTQLAYNEQGDSISDVHPLASDWSAAACGQKRSTGFFGWLGDVLGFDGAFGYDGPDFGKLSFENWGRAVVGRSASDDEEWIIITGRSTDYFIDGWKERGQTGVTRSVFNDPAYNTGVQTRQWFQEYRPMVRAAGLLQGIAGTVEVDAARATHSCRTFCAPRTSSASRSIM